MNIYQIIIVAIGTLFIASYLFTKGTPKQKIEHYRTQIDFIQDPKHKWIGYLYTIIDVVFIILLTLLSVK